MPLLRVAVLTAVSSALLAVHATSQAPPAGPGRAAPRAWEHESSDLPVHPRARFGALPSGLRYAWMENAEPKQRVCLRLHVDVGSLAESDAERGMAHFLEHMAFNGSRNFPAGTLVEWLQRHGLGFGGDTNALTDFSQTVYQLDLPTNDAAMVADGLRVFRDIVDGLLLAQTEIDREKGVIDGEERERESAQFRSMRKALDVVFAGTRIPVRLPIGIKSARDAFDSAAMRAFWQRWYRPDLCTLLVVGDLGGRDPTGAIEKAFGDLAAPASPGPSEPPLGVAVPTHRAFAVFDREIPSLTLNVQLLRPHVDRPDRKAKRIDELAADYARGMVNLRLTRLLSKDATPFLHAQLGEGGGMRSLEGEALMVVCVPDRWQEALRTVQLELRSALKHGFQPAELEEVRADSLRALAEAVEQEPTLDSELLVGELLAACEERYVPVDATTTRDLYEGPTRALTPEACQHALQEAWSSGQLVISAIGGRDFGATAEAELVAAWEAGAATDVAAQQAAPAGAFAYGTDPALAGKVAARTTDAEFGFEEVAYANGARLVVKRTDFEERQILVKVLVGEGVLSLAPEDSPLKTFAEQTFLAGGLGRHAIDEIVRLTAGKAVGLSFGILDEAFVLGGATTAEDLGFQCELACAYLVDPGLREEGATQFRRALPSLYEQQKHQHGGAIASGFLPKLYADDPRVRFPALEVVQGITMAQVGTWLRGAFDAAPITVVVVGDVDVDAAIRSVGATFGSLPPRRERRLHAERRAFPPMAAGLRESYAIDTDLPTSLVLVQYATTDGAHTPTRRGLNWLTDVVNDRLRLEIREKLGAAYSPRASASSSMTLPGNGSLAMQAMCEPGRAQGLVDALLAVGERLATEGVAEEEVARLRPEVLARLRDAQRANGWWLEVLGNFHQARPVREDLRTMVAMAEQMSAATISALAKKYLVSAKASVAIVHPRSAAKPASPPPSRDGG
jgi:zinc protease